VPRAYIIAATVSETACGKTPILLLNFIKVIQERDRLACDRLAKGDPTGAWSIYNGVTIRRGLIYIPPCVALREELISRNHNDPIAGHYGPAKTISAL